MITDDGAKTLIANILKQAHEDYINDDRCLPYCPLIKTCENRENDKKRYDAKKFIHSYWCAALCDGINIDHKKYVDRNIDKCRLTKNVTRFIVGELRAYEANKKIIESVKRDIILAGAEQQEVRSTSTGDPTLSKVIKIEGKIYSDKQLQQTQAIVKAIQTIYNRLDVEKKELLNNCYFRQRYTIDGMAYKLNIDRATVYRWKTSIIRDIAIYLGYL